MNIKLIRNQSDVWTILLRCLAASVLLSLLVLPWLWAVNEMRWNLAIDWSEILWAVRNSSVQAAWSAAVAICLGVPGALGLLYFSSKAKTRRILNVLFLGPNFLPAIFLLISCLQLFGRSLFGVFGIALVHGFMNAGLVAVGIAGKSDEDLGSTCELSLVMGAPRLLFLRSIWLPLVAHDILKYYLMVFVFSFGALTVPLVLGGSSGTTLEVLILEKLRVEGSLPSATVLAFAQGILLLLLSQAIGIFSQFRQKAKVRVGDGIESGHGIFPKTYSWLPGLSFGFFGSFVLGGGLILGASEILLQKPSLLNEILFDSDFQLAVVGTMAVMGLMYLAVHFTLAFSLMILPRLSFLRWTEHLSFQSAAFVGFGLMLFGRQVGVEFWVSFPISMIVLLWPSFFAAGLALQDGTIKSKVC